MIAPYTKTKMILAGISAPATLIPVTNPLERLTKRWRAAPTSSASYEDSITALSAPCSSSRTTNISITTIYADRGHGRLDTPNVCAFAISACRKLLVRHRLLWEPTLECHDGRLLRDDAREGRASWRTASIAHYAS
jgi:hypothetical protein